MQCGSLVGDVLSPESTVSALLSSSGHLRSSLVPERNATFTYRDKDYTSASEALDAYIADFEQSHGAGESAAGRLVLPGRRHAGATGPRTAPRNRDVLRERLTDRELDFLTLPVSSLRHRGNRDRLSMTTEELLSIPCDGSMPVTHTSAFLRGPLSRSADAPGSSSRLRSRVGLSGAPSLGREDPAARTCWTPRSRGEAGGAAMLRPDCHVSHLSSFQAADGHVGLERPLQAAAAAASSSLHFPRWFTSHKSEMNFSGVSSVPELTYPTWIHSCEDHEPGGVRAPSWVAELDDDEATHSAAEAETEHQQTLRALRLQFAEQISLVASDRKQSDVMDSLFRDNKLESLIHQAESVLNSLSGSLRGGADGLQPRPPTPGSPASCSSVPISPGGSEEPVGEKRPADAEEPLDARRSRDSRPPAQNCPEAAGGATASLTAGEAEAGGSWCSSRKLPGPVEALKQMMFRLQAVEAELQRQQHTHPASAHTHPAAAHTHPASAHTHPAAAHTHTPGLDTHTLDLDTHTLDTERTAAQQFSSRHKASPESQQPDCSSGGASLHRALQHLETLRSLVDEEGGRGGAGPR
ncbi:lung adenoma susceptibility protein 2 isoform X2 [Myripristis murdjan]|uniref:lung adenoma susceptibility protein 2 isoform X2 n=1 Tax=Myripristis murdjan TaxID=586833 RepID=UPI001175E4B2|nr:lung adenoma susceptibility protein 2 isoform X2 [Myripristis murdjan]